MKQLAKAEAAAASAEGVAAAAMKACEVAVKEEMQARAVVKVWTTTITLMGGRGAGGEQTGV